MTTTTDEFFRRWADISAINAAAAVLAWDQETHMPPKGQPARGRHLAVLAGLAHERLCDPALADVIDEVAREAEPGSDLDAQVREARRAVTRATAVPGELARALAEHQSKALTSWQQARAANEFPLFAADLERMVVLTSERADAYVDAGIAEQRYDALLDDYEPGARQATLTPLLQALATELSPLVLAVADSGRTIDESVCRGSFPPDAQRAFAVEVATAMGYDFGAGRLDESAHPFTTGFGPNDVRITWRWHDDDFRPGLFGVMHETGHALYEQGLPVDWDGTPIGKAISLGVHESQSRLWENQVGRSRAFWEWALPRFRRYFPDHTSFGLDDLWPALHTVTPSLIRVEADETTYNLHIVVRYELERQLFSGDLAVMDLPDAWAASYEDLLGIRPSGVDEGVLQDIHWAMGAFGYFPTYTLGNLLAAQLFEAAERELTDLSGLLSAGEFDALLAWLRHTIHTKASRYSVEELILQATGTRLTPDPFLRYLRANVEAAYGFAV
ncbi:MAG: carboxypeptidase M32 [Acidimicrobiales bacterium]|nr:carboxypeptidase M32 [Acidimicrobiales bacterium]